MVAPRTLQRLHKLIWTLIYGGLLTLVLGIATGRTDGALGWSLVVGGALVAVVGVALIAVRARLKAG
ncbi:hypothetical protein KW843_08865 [Acidovorax sp. sif1233]|uniref:hypothetical protein n=1 Tax=unclassified Acidovorax TaxID=2684926 RepID=UPI001C449A3A|nr:MULTISPECIES: hypothetical protein [unclassified Acidovorax]MBV7430104.1 hypothetical protein [Acidovorax sp. sif0732]MBV7451497.1 hypothetical protein [Acidovorax sp. sif0715]MBV7454578.1 hypothetical protein [Acidovorax sp. sif1233]